MNVYLIDNHLKKLQAIKKWIQTFKAEFKLQNFFS